MRNLLFVLFGLLCFCTTGTAEQIKVFQLNIWMGTTQVENGFQVTVDQIAAADADFVTLCEVRSENGMFIPRLLASLKERGMVYYGDMNDDCAVLSKYPIVETSVVNDDVFKAVSMYDGRRVAVYSAHLNYLYYACYYPRGYDGNTWKKMDSPITDVDKILANNRASGRPEAIRGFVDDAKKEFESGASVFLGGDFNEPSHLDWQDDTKDLWEHNGCVVPWDTSLLLYENGFKDAYRVKYPDAVKYPGFTFPADNKDSKLEILSWAPDSDERDRIDFIYYYPANGLRVKSAYVVGPQGSVAYGARVGENGKEPYILPANGHWPTDHKGGLILFKL